MNSIKLVIPQDEILWVRYVENDVVKYIITSNLYRTEYYLYKISSNKPKKTKYKSSNPLDLEKYVKLKGE